MEATLPRPRGSVEVVVVVVAVVVDVIAPDDADPVCGVDDPAPRADPSPPTAAEIVPTVAGTRALRGGANVPETASDAPLFRPAAPEATVSINP